MNQTKLIKDVSQPFQVQTKASRKQKYLSRAMEAPQCLLSSSGNLNIYNQKQERSLEEAWTQLALN